MLTKEEREAIAERANKATHRSDSIYEVLLGHISPDYVPLKDDFEDMIARIIDLCDTSNMVELPLDKDGEVIRIGDTVYDYENIEYKVEGYTVYKSCTCAFLTNTAELIYAKRDVNNLTHKQPVTIKSLAQRIKHVLEDEATSIGVNPYVELGRIAEQLESLGGGND